jgi:hypothetical protein
MPGCLLLIKNKKGLIMSQNKNKSVNSDSCSGVSYQDCTQHGYGCEWIGTPNHGHCEVVGSKPSAPDSRNKQGSAQKTNSCSQKTKATCQSTYGCTWDETNHICKLPYTPSK